MCCLIVLVIIAGYRIGLFRRTRAANTEPATRIASPVPALPNTSLPASKSESTLASSPTVPKQDNVVTNEQILYQLRRVQSPINHNFDLELRLDIPLDQPSIQEYLRRIQPVSRGNVYIKPDSEYFPSLQIPAELPLARVAWSQSIRVTFSRKIDLSSEKEDHYEITGDCTQPKNSPPGDVPSISLDWYPGKNSLVLDCRVPNLEGTGTFRSYLDFDDSTALVSISPLSPSRNSKLFDGPKVSIEFDLFFLSSGERGRVLRNLKKVECPLLISYDQHSGVPVVFGGPSSMCFSAVMPKDAFGPE